LVEPGGLLIYSTCSLEPEEGPARIADFLRQRSEFARVPLAPAEIGGHPDWMTPGGDLRTLPFHSPAGGQEPGGMDGFYAARLRRHEGGRPT
jgi:16S rRNA (cytosine967-C5)-methyltransferase